MPSATDDLLVPRRAGLYCPAGDFYIDPMRKVDRAVITHAHADHARAGHARYLAHHDSAELLRQRLGRGISLQTLAYGEVLPIGPVRLSLHPAGHVLGSSQVRVEHGGRVWVASGDYFLSGAGDTNPTCVPFEPVRCDCFITESTFGLPIYRWQTHASVFAELHAWWQRNQAAGRPSLLQAYSLGKAQRVLAGLTAAIGPIVVHPSVAALNEAYAAAGIALPATLNLTAARRDDLRGALVIAPPTAADSAAGQALRDASIAFASGWMQVRRAARQRGQAQGFVLSDHADWPGLLQAIGATGCERVIVHHGFDAVLARHLQGSDWQAGVLGPPRDDPHASPANA